MAPGTSTLTWMLQRKGAEEEEEGDRRGGRYTLARGNRGRARQAREGRRKPRAPCSLVAAPGRCQAARQRQKRTLAAGVRDLRACALLAGH